MKVIKTFTVTPSLPDSLKAIRKLAYNLWFCWNPEAISLFQRLHRDLWEERGHSPVWMLNRIDQGHLERLSKDDGFLAQLEQVSQSFDRYLGEGGKESNFRVAYFSAEFGLTESLPIYSGGLGILSGDHLKSSSDLDIPLVGVGLLYQEGYFRQFLNDDGWQGEMASVLDFPDQPLILVRKENGEPLQIEVSLKGTTVRVRIWRVQVGRISLYLLDTNCPENPPELRKITAQLYGGSTETRLQQEIVLGVGGVRALKALGIEPTVFHMNEGHSAFAALERIRLLKELTGTSFDAAMMAVISGNVFTTHTPVPAGMDIFDRDLMEAYFSDYAGDLGISMPVLLALGRANPWQKDEPFGMTILAIRLSAYVNGVSRIHGEVSRKMWQGIWAELPVEDVPITHITNGVHIPSWISHEMATLYDRYLGPRWVEDPDNERVWERIDQIPDSELWRTHEHRRERLVTFCRKRLQQQLERRGAPWSEIAEVSEILNPEALTLGFARRFAPYKRGTLLFRDPDRLERIINDPKRPVQIIFAGKAHPNNNEGKELIQQIIHICRQERFLHRIVFIEDYDINVARYLVQGADVWVNTPRRPLEACGTSGMKVVANGGLNLSVLDGWWAEGYDIDNGWTIGSGEDYKDPSYQDEIEGRALYNLLEKEVIPLFYEKSLDRIPRGWIARMRASMRTLCPVFNSHRMILEYRDRFYRPASERWSLLTKDDAAAAKEFAEFKQKLMVHWEVIRIDRVEAKEVAELAVGSSLEVDAEIYLGEIDPGEVIVELYYGQIGGNEELQNRQTAVALPKGEGKEGTYIYRGKITCNQAGRFGLALRILPHHHNLENPYLINLVHWAGV
ncbi:MAG: alpha-glucan family phosphorylase [Desulfatiglandales bacterium]